MYRILVVFQDFILQYICEWEQYLPNPSVCHSTCFHHCYVCNAILEMLSRKKDQRTIKEGVVGKYVKKETPPEMPSEWSIV